MSLFGRARRLPHIAVWWGRRQPGSEAREHQRGVVKVTSSTAMNTTAKYRVPIVSASSLRAKPHDNVAASLMHGRQVACQGSREKGVSLHRKPSKWPRHRFFSVIPDESCHPNHSASRTFSTIQNEVSRYIVARCWAWCEHRRCRTQRLGR